MASEKIHQYRLQYKKLLRYYPKPYYESFGESIEQTFADLLSEREKEGGELFTFAVWTFFETSTEIIKENIRLKLMQDTLKRLIIWAIIIALVLMIPLFARWPWNGFDFIFAIVVLYGAALAFELIARKMSNRSFKFAVGIAVISTLLLVWINAAVGIIGEDEWPNLMYLGIALFGIIGALLSRFRAKGLARTAFIMSAAVILAPIIVLLVAKPLIMENPGIAGVFAISAFFSISFALSGILFNKASVVKF